MNTQAQQGKSQRALTRFPMNSPVTVTINECKTVIQGMCRNMSGSGMLIHLDKNVPADAVLTVAMNQGKIDFNSEARVVRITQNGDEYHLAIAMTQQH